MKLNPSRYLLRITEYLAGPPVHEELASLQEHTERLKERAEQLQVENQDLEQKLLALSGERDLLKRQATALRLECEQLKTRIQASENERRELRERNERWMDFPKVENLSKVETIVPGTFALLNFSDDGSSYLRCVDGKSLDVAQKAAYDPVTDQLLFVGSYVDTSGVNGSYLLRYNVAANRWRSEPVPPSYGGGGSYDTHALNAAARELYVSSRLRANTLRRMNIDTGEWSSMAQPDTIGCVSSEPSAEYFPDRDELIWLQGKRFGVWRRSTDSWKLVSAVLGGLGSRSAIARYCPTERCVLIFGGADTNTAPATIPRGLYRYDADGQVTRLSDMPGSVAIYFNRAIAAIDPATGDLIVIQAALGPDIMDFTGRLELWQYRITTDSWTQLDEAMIPDTSCWWAETYPAGVIAAPVNRHNVILFASFAGIKSAVFVYKHTSGAGGPNKD